MSRTGRPRPPAEGREARERREGGRQAIGDEEP